MTEQMDTITAGQCTNAPASYDDLSVPISRLPSSAACQAS